MDNLTTGARQKTPTSDSASLSFQLLNSTQQTKAGGLPPFAYPTVTTMWPTNLPASAVIEFSRLPRVYPLDCGVSLCYVMLHWLNTGL